MVLGLLAVAAAVALWLDRADRAERSVAAILALIGSIAAAAAALLVPGAAGHAAQTSPRALALALDWLHLAAGSVWIGGLLGLVVLWGSLPPDRRLAGLVVCVPRFSAAALVSVVVLVGSGIGAAIIHLPTLASLWQTSYGKSLLVKVALLVLATPLAAVNLTRTRPRLQVAELAPRATVMLRRLVGGEVLLLVGALFAAGVLSSLPPPATALAAVGAANAH